MANNRSAFARLAASTILAATTLLGGCAMAGGAKPAQYVSQAESALAKGQTGKGIALAEKAVVANPRDAATRALLGAAYLKAGRFASATEAYDAALELGDESVPTVLGLALSETAQGNEAAAIELLTDWRDVLPASDLGLAYALAGNARRGVAVLTDAVRNGDNSVKARQNLAFAYALAGQWPEARLMLAQDVPADQINDRIGQWAQLTVPGADQMRVAHLLGVPLIGDSGQPAELALANFPSVEALAYEAGSRAAPEAAAPAAPAPVEVAVVESAPVAIAPAEPAPIQYVVLEQPPLNVATVAIAQVEPAPVRYAALEQPISNVASDTPQFAPAFSSTPVVQTLAALPAQFRPAPTQFRTAPAKKPRVVGSFVPHGSDGARTGAGRSGGGSLTAPKVAKPVTGGSHWLQLGSYVDPVIAKEGWGKFIKRTPALKAYQATTTTATVKGTPVWRVAATGFSSYGDAANLCRTVKHRGGECLVVTAPKGLGGGRIAARR